MTPEQIAAGLSEAQKRALLNCTPWDVCVGAGIAIAFCANGFLQDSTILDDGVELTPVAQAVRLILEQEHEAK
jgi:hypothetical protein